MSALLLFVYVNLKNISAINHKLTFDKEKFRIILSNL